MTTADPNTEARAPATTSTAAQSDSARLDALELPIVDGRVEWKHLTIEQLHTVIRGAAQLVEQLEPAEPTAGVLNRSLDVEASVRALSPLQHRYAGLLKDAFDTPKLRHTVELPEGKTPFRDAKDLVAKTHGLRATEATVAVGDTKLPLLGALQPTGQIHPTKLASALHMLTEIDDNAQAAGKDQAFRDELRAVVEKALAEKIEHTSPEEFSRYAGRRKEDLLAAIDPPDKQFAPAQTEAMYDAKCVGPVRGNPDAIKWRIVASAEFAEVAHTLFSTATNPRTRKNNDDDSDHEDDEKAWDTRSTGHQPMDVLADALKFALANLGNAAVRAASGSHTKMIIMADYPTLMQQLRHELAELLPDIHRERREKLLAFLTEAELPRTNDDDATPDHYPADTSVDIGATSDDAAVDVPVRAAAKPPETITLGDTVLTVPPKTSNLDEMLDADNLDRLQPRVSQGIYTPYIPPEVAVRLLCDVGVTPVTLTGQREVLSIGRMQRRFPHHIRKAILARDRGCAVPDCHWPAAWCEIHHILYWSNNGETSTDNGILTTSGSPNQTAPSLQRTSSVWLRRTLRRHPVKYPFEHCTGVTGNSKVIIFKLPDLA